MAATHFFRFPGPLLSPVLFQGSRAPALMAGSVAGHGSVTAPILGNGTVAGSTGGSSQTTFGLSPATHYYRSLCGIPFCPTLFAGHFIGLLAEGGITTGTGHASADLTATGTLSTSTQGHGQLTGAFNVPSFAPAHFFLSPLSPFALTTYRRWEGNIAPLPTAAGKGTASAALTGIAGIVAQVFGHSSTSLGVPRSGANFQWLVPGFLQQPKNISGAATGTISAQLSGQGALAATLKGAGRFTSATGGQGTLSGGLHVPGGLFGAILSHGSATAPGTGIGVLTAFLPAKGTLLGTAGKAGAGTLSGHGGVLADLLGKGMLQGVAGGKGTWTGALWGAGNQTTGGHGNATAVLRGASGLLGSVAGHSSVTAGHNLISGSAAGHGSLTTFLLGQMSAAVSGSGTVKGRAKRKRKPPHKNRVDLL